MFEGCLRDVYCDIQKCTAYPPHLQATVRPTASPEPPSPTAPPQPPSPTQPLPPTPPMHGTGVCDLPTLMQCFAEGEDATVHWGGHTRTAPHMGPLVRGALGSHKLKGEDKSKLSEGNGWAYTTEDGKDVTGIMCTCLYAPMYTR